MFSTAVNIAVRDAARGLTVYAIPTARRGNRAGDSRWSLTRSMKEIAR